MRERHLCLALLLPYPLDPQVGGVQRMTWQLGHYFAGRGWRVVYISLAPTGHCQPGPGTLEHPVRELGERVGPIRAYLAEVIARHRPDVVINQMALSRAINTALWQASGGGRRCAVLACYHNSPALYRNSLRHILGHRLRRRPLLRGLVDHVAGRWLLCTRHRLLTAIGFRRAMRHCHRLVLLSPTYFDELRWFVPEADPRKLVAIANGFALPLPPPPQVKRQRLLFVGRMNNLQKNVFLLPELWARLHGLLPDWELHMVGDGGDLAELKAMFADRALPRVVFHGRQDPAAHYRAARLFLMVSAYEGFPLTVIEAQAQGVVPLAFATCSALDWMLHQGTDARVIPANDIAALTAAIVELADDPERLATMSAAAIANAGRFAEARIGRQWKALIDELGVTL